MKLIQRTLPGCLLLHWSVHISIQAACRHALGVECGVEPLRTSTDRRSRFYSIGYTDPIGLPIPILPALVFGYV